LGEEKEKKMSDNAMGEIQPQVVPQPLQSQVDDAVVYLKGHSNGAVHMAYTIGLKVTLTFSMTLSKNCNI
jgi:hypothetical protein